MYNSKYFKKLYLNTLDKEKLDLDKIKFALSITKDKNAIDILLDTFNYVLTSYNIIKMQYLILYVSLYLNEKKIVQNQSIPINTSLKILMKQNWITQDTKDFLKKHFSKVLIENLDYSIYVKDLDTYLNNINIFK